MSLIHPRILDLLRGRETLPRFLINDGVDRRSVARMMRDAEVFDFGDLALQHSTELNPITKDPQWDVPELTAEEEGFFEEGLIPLPSEFVWYEFVLDDPNQRSGLLVGPGFEVMRMDFDSLRGWGCVDGCVVRRRPEGDYETIGPADFLAKMAKDPVHAEGLNFGANHSLARYLTLMLNSRSTEKRAVEAGPRPASGNRHALPAHTVVTIVPKRFVGERSDGERGTHASPRLHWRRSHLREYRAPSGGVYHRVVIPRSLVGKDELGAVTHTYRVKRED